jgi:hypothetical protein
MNAFTRTYPQFPGLVVHYNHPWVRRWIKAAAICLGDHVFTSEQFLSEHTLAHEYCHVAQYEVYGFWGYLARWFYWTWKYGYYKNPFEAQAFAYADIRVPLVFVPYGPEWSGLRWLDAGQDSTQADLWPY